MNNWDDKRPETPTEFFLNCLGSEDKPKRSLIEKIQYILRKVMSILCSESL